MHRKPNKFIIQDFGTIEKDLYGKFTTPSLDEINTKLENIGGMRYGATIELEIDIVFRSLIENKSLFRLNQNHLYTDSNINDHEFHHSIKTLLEKS